MGRTVNSHYNGLAFTSTMVQYYVEKVTQKMPFLYTAGAKYVSFDNQTLNPEAFVPSLTKSIAISHFFA